MNKNTLPQSIKEVVKFINKFGDKNPSFCQRLLKQHLDTTIKFGYIYTKSGFSRNEIPVISPIESKKELIPFLSFKNNIYNKIAKTYVMEFLTGMYLEEYARMTTPCRVMGIDRTYAKTYGDAMFEMFDFLAINPGTFKDPDIQIFCDLFVDTLFARTTYPKILDPEKQTQLSPVYEKMNGMYYFDAQILYYMTKTLADRGLDTSKVKTAFEKLPFQEDLGQTYIPIYKQMDKFEDFVSGAMYILDNQAEFFEGAKQKDSQADHAVDLER